MAVAIIAIVAAMMVSSLLTNPAWDFGYAFQIMQQSSVINGLWMGTILGTVGSMILGVVLGVILAVMRLSDNFVLRGSPSSTPGSSGPCPGTSCSPSWPAASATSTTSSTSACRSGSRSRSRWV